MNASLAPETGPRHSVAGQQHRCSSAALANAYVIYPRFSMS
ncbi:hypothetical protein SJ05684_c36670 [Sinorhizobium sojae CCBAU 05684]|uniref:Uncharacterized protein n=1 Tax=Sinorhizobium sojae CCBAU 05684 TaxID=716928 RepID=A0A249PGJ3_9HYPH|nr:hypothetical protein SJ05684_c36670 [Sinorhizobium sojae CCBAU 05684]